LKTKNLEKNPQKGGCLKNLPRRRETIKKQNGASYRKKTDWRTKEALRTQKKGPRKASMNASHARLARHPQARRQAKEQAMQMQWNSKKTETSLTAGNQKRKKEGCLIRKLNRVPPPVHFFNSFRKAKKKGGKHDERNTGRTPKSNIDKGRNEEPNPRGHQSQSTKTSSFDKQSEPGGQKKPSGKKTPENRPRTFLWEKTA